MWLRRPHYPKYHFNIPALSFLQKACQRSLKERLSTSSCCRSALPTWSVPTNKESDPWNTSINTKVSLHESPLSLVPAPSPVPHFFINHPHMQKKKHARPEWIVALLVTEGVVYVPELPTSPCCSWWPVYLAPVMVSVTGDWREEILIYSRCLFTYCPVACAALTSNPWLWGWPMRGSVFVLQHGAAWGFSVDCVRMCVCLKKLIETDSNISHPFLSREHMHL